MEELNSLEKQIDEKELKEISQNSKPEDSVWATGRRKTSIARIKMVKGTGKLIINHKSPDEYFGGNVVKLEIYKPSKIIPEHSKYDFIINVTGGGLTGQAESIRHGISRALASLSDTFRKKLKDAGLLRRDPRMVERKKPGQPKARKKFQWTKR